MRTVYERELANAAKISGQIATGADRFVQSPVGAVCKALWPPPLKADVEIGLICGCDPRNARRYMSGEIPIPAVLLAAINVRLTTRS